MAENHIGNLKKQQETEDTSAKARAHTKRTASRRSDRLRLNLFDFLIIFVVLLAIALLATGVHLTDLLGAREEGTPVRLTYTLRLADVDETFASAIKSGDVIYDTATKVPIGTVKQTPIVTAHTEPTAVTTTAGTTVAEMKAVPGRVDVTLVISAEAVYEQTLGYRVEGVSVRVGSSYTVRNAAFTGDAQCVAFNGAVKVQGREAVQ